MKGLEQASVPNTNRAIAAVRRTPVAIFAYRDARQRPLAWPVTPYTDGNEIVVTSTLAFIRKAVHVRRDRRVALLAGGLHMTGEARVEVDPRGDDFVEHFLDQEIEKYPPAAEIVATPLARTLFWWFFGRVFIRFAPSTLDRRPGDDAASLVSLDPGGFPSIHPIVEPPCRDNVFMPEGLGPDLAKVENQSPACVLLHREPTMRDLRQLLLRGEIEGGCFRATSRHGSLAPAASGIVAELKRHVGYHRSAFASRKQIAAWTAKEVDT